MDRLYLPGDRSFESINYVGLAIRNIEGDQRHIGILFRDDRTPDVTFLHLAFHRRLIAGSPNPTYSWIDPAIDARRLRHLATICRQLSAANGQNIPYGFSTPNDWFDEDTLACLQGPSNVGLTCATFVLAAFRTGGLQLLHYEAWPHRAGDTDWQNHVIGLLQADDAPQEHIAAVRAEVGAVRVRPEEVGGAAMLQERPSAYEAVIAQAARLLEVLPPP